MCLGRSLYQRETCFLVVSRGDSEMIPRSQPVHVGKCAGFATAWFCVHTLVGGCGINNDQDPLTYLPIPFEAQSRKMPITPTFPNPRQAQKAKHELNEAQDQWQAQAGSSGVFAYVVTFGFHTLQSRRSWYKCITST